MMKNLLMWGLVLGLGMALTACGDDGGTDNGTGGGDEDMGMAGGADVQAFDGAALVDPDFSCLGAAENVAPTNEGATPEAFVAQAGDFLENNEPVAGLTFRFFDSNEASDTCGDGCQEVTTDAAAQAMVMATPGEWYAYAVQPGEAMRENGPGPEAYAQVQQKNELATSGEGIGIIAVRSSTITAITLLLGIAQQAGTSTISGQALDCQGRTLTNVVIRAFDSSGAAITFSGGSNPADFYFEGGSPSPTPDATDASGLFGAGNLPTGGDLRVETWGSVDGTMQMIGCENVPSPADGISVVNISPQRADGPSDCSG